MNANTISCLGGYAVAAYSMGKRKNDFLRVDVVGWEGDKMNTDNLITDEEQKMIDDMDQGLREIRDSFDQMSSNLTLVFPILDDATPNVRNAFFKAADELVIMINRSANNLETLISNARKKYNA